MKAEHFDVSDRCFLVYSEYDGLSDSIINQFLQFLYQSYFI